jgi:hypothetical protein
MGEELDSVIVLSPEGKLIGRIRLPNGARYQSLLWWREPESTAHGRKPIDIHPT